MTVVSITSTKLIMCLFNDKFHCLTSCDQSWLLADTASVTLSQREKWVWHTAELLGKGACVTTSPGFLCLYLMTNSMKPCKLR